MDEELALLRGIALNPYDDVRRGAYADWLDENGEPDAARQVRATFMRAVPKDANYMLNYELIGLLLNFPLDAGIIYDAYSDYNTMQPNDVTLIRAEERAVIFREQQGYVRYEPVLFESTCPPHLRERFAELRRLYPRSYYGPGERPDFRTVVHFPGN